jgi:hypothetical protein
MDARPVQQIQGCLVPYARLFFASGIDTASAFLEILRSVFLNFFAGHGPTAIE